MIFSYLFSLCVFIGCVAFLCLNFIISGFALEGTSARGPYILYVFNLVMLVVPLYPILVLCAGYTGNLEDGSIADRFLGVKASKIVAIVFAVLIVALLVMGWSSDFAFSLFMVIVLIGLAWFALKLKEREQN